eukprot:Clim_evm3s251 gene=Clim_evmTU3s251
MLSALQKRSIARQLTTSRTFATKVGGSGTTRRGRQKGTGSPVTSSKKASDRTPAKKVAAARTAKSTKAAKATKITKPAFWKVREQYGVSSGVFGIDLFADRSTRSESATSQWMYSFDANQQLSKLVDRRMDSLFREGSPLVDVNRLASLGLKGALNQTHVNEEEQKNPESDSIQETVKKVNTRTFVVSNVPEHATIRDIESLFPSSTIVRAAQKRFFDQSLTDRTPRSEALRMQLEYSDAHRAADRLPYDLVPAKSGRRALPARALVRPMVFNVLGSSQWVVEIEDSGEHDKADLFSGFLGSAKEGNGDTNLERMPWRSNLPPHGSHVGLNRVKVTEIPCYGDLNDHQRERHRRRVAFDNLIWDPIQQFQGRAVLTGPFYTNMRDLDTQFTLKFLQDIDVACFKDDMDVDFHNVPPVSVHTVHGLGSKWVLTLCRTEADAARLVRRLHGVNDEHINSTLRTRRAVDSAPQSGSGWYRISNVEEDAIADEQKRDLGPLVSKILW